MRFAELLDDIFSGNRVRRTTGPWQEYGLNDAASFVCFVKPEGDPEDELFLDAQDIWKIFNSDDWELVPSQD